MLVTATRLLSLLLCLTALVAAGCGNRDGGSSGGGLDAHGSAGDPEAAATVTPTPTPTATPAPVRGRFAVGGGRRLWLRCTGGGAPTVVYLHPYVETARDDGSEAAGRLPGLLGRTHRTCVYDRANVGRSSAVDGIQTGEDSVRDLHELLGNAGVDGPFILLGSGFGGLLADMYAATYPAEVAGMVMLDGDLPGDLDIQQRFLRASQQLQPGNWHGTVERLDRLETFRQAQRLEGDEPEVPVTYIGPKDLRLDPSLPVTRVTAVIRDMQQTFLDRFDPGRLQLLDTPVPMEPFVTDEIVAAVEQVSDDATGD